MTNAHHGAPKNWDAERDGPCETLPTITVCDTDNVPILHASFWQPDPAEMDLLLKGGALELHVAAPVHPVVSLRVNAWPGVRHDENGREMPTAQDATGEGDRIADAVLQWLLMRGFADGGCEYHASDIVAILDENIVTNDSELVPEVVSTAQDDKIREAIRSTIGFNFEPNELQMVNANDLLRLAAALTDHVNDENGAPLASEDTK